MQITEQLIERIARRVFNALFPSSLRSSGAVISGSGSSVHYADEAGYANDAGHAASADAVPWTGVTSKPATATRWPAWSEVTSKPSWIGSTKPSYTLDEVGDGSTRKLANYLPLAGGTMTGTLKIATGYGISDATDNGMLCYHPVDWTGVSNSQWGVGAVDSVGVIRSNSAALKHYRNGDNTYDIIDSKGGQTIANSLQIGSSNGAYLQIGAIRLVYDSANNAIKVIKSDGGDANFYATGGVSALGV